MKTFLEAIFPKRCVNCNRILGDFNEFLCIKCLSSLPYTYWGFNNENELFSMLYGKLNLNKASALLRFESGNITQKLLHANKYFNQPKIGAFLAELSINQLKDNDIDLVLAVPSHKRTKRLRNYNQVEVFAKTIANSISAEYKPKAIKRIGRKKSQVNKSRLERLDLLTNSFKLVQNLSKYQHILLVDDLVTSGSTIIANSLEIQRDFNGKLSVFAMAKVD